MNKTLLSTVVASILLVGCGGGGGSSNPVEDNINNGGQTSNNGDSTSNNGNTSPTIGGTLEIETVSSKGVQHFDVSYKPYPLGDITENSPKFQNENSKTGRLVKPDFNIAAPQAPQEFLTLAEKFNGIPVNNISFTKPNGERHSGFLNTDIYYFDPYKTANFDEDALKKYNEEFETYLAEYDAWKLAHDNNEEEGKDENQPTAPQFDPKIYKISDIIQMKARYSTVTSILESKSTPTVSAYGDYDYENRGLALVYVPQNQLYYTMNNTSNNLQDDLVTKPKVEQQVLNYKDENGVWKTEILVTVQVENSENLSNNFTKNGKSNPNQSIKQSYIYELVDLSGADSTAHIYANFPKEYAFSKILRTRINGQVCDPNTNAKRYCFPTNAYAYRLKASYTPEIFYATTKTARSEPSIADLMNNWFNNYIHDHDSGYTGRFNTAFTTHFKYTANTSNTRLMYLDPFGKVNENGIISGVPLLDEVVFSYYNKLYKGGYRPATNYIFNRDEGGIDCTVNNGNAECSYMEHTDLSGRFLGSRWVYNDVAYTQLKNQINDNIGN